MAADALRITAGPAPGEQTVVDTEVVVGGEADATGLAADVVLDDLPPR